MARDDSRESLASLIYFTMMFLWIDSTAAETVRIGLSVKRPSTTSRVVWRTFHTRDVLAAVTRALCKHRRENILPVPPLHKRGQGSSFKDIAGIAVFQGPGPFSRVRAGVTVANTLAFALNIPLWALYNSKLRRARGVLAPHYGKLPNITWA